MWKRRGESFMDNRRQAVRLLYIGCMILCGALAGIWAFTANRFQISESIMIIIGGMVAGSGLGAICHAMISLLRK